MSMLSEKAASKIISQLQPKQAVQAQPQAGRMSDEQENSHHEPT